MFSKKFVFSKVGFILGIIVCIYFTVTDSSGLNEGDIMLVFVWGLFAFALGLTLVGLAIDGLFILFQKMLKKAS